MIAPLTSTWTISSEADLIYTMPPGKVPRKIILEVHLPMNQGWFGSNQVPALVNWKHISEFGQLDHLQEIVHYLQRASLVILPLLTAALMIILDHATTVMYVTYIGIALAARALLSTIYETTSQETQSLIEWLIVLLMTFSPILFIKLALHLVRLSVPATYLLGLGAANFAIHLWILNSQPIFIEKADMWNDGIGLMICMLITLWGVLRTPPESHNSSLIAVGEKKASLVLATLIFATNGSAIFWDLLTFGTQDESTFTAWLHQLLVPALFFVSLVHIGSVVNTINRVSLIIKEKTKIDRDIEIGRKLQSGILPEKKFQNSSFQWHAFYYPASRLAGDWFDLREITTQDKRTFLLACIVDVTGHGISSAMMTSNIASHWGIWSGSLSEMDAPEDPERRNQILITAPYHIHRGLVGLRYNLGCSMAVLMYEPTTQMLTYLTAGHPGIVLSDGDGSFEYLTSKGTRPGITNGDHSWSARTLTLSPSKKTLVMFTDGIVEENLTVPTWLQRIRRKSRSEKKSPVHYITSQLRKNRKLFMEHSEKEDDLTLLVIQLREEAREKVASTPIKIGA